MLYKRIIAKFGTNLLTRGTQHLDTSIISELVQQIAYLQKKGHEIIIVTSGAVAAGRQRLNLSKEHNKDIPVKQVLAAIGQGHLMHIYEQLFIQHDITVAQALLTKSDLTNRSGYLNARNTLISLLELNAICIVNENDVVATDEIQGTRFGDNDNLSAMVANLVDADLLVLLTDIDGLYSANPQLDPLATLIPKVEKIDIKIQRLAGKSGSMVGTGGMATKIEAAKMATSCGTTVVIACGYEPDNLIRVVEGKPIGTIFTPLTTKLESKKRWMISGLASKGRLTIDQGAALALTIDNKSLLPAGITSLEGKFQRGNVIDIFDTEGKRIGCGISNYSAQEIAAIKGAHSNSVSGILGYDYGSEIVHRSNMVLL
jgi:glutamate 5-kinase